MSRLTTVSDLDRGQDEPRLDLENELADRESFVGHGAREARRDRLDFPLTKPEPISHLRAKRVGGPICIGNIALPAVPAPATD